MSRLPSAQGRIGANDSEMFSITKLRSTNNQANRLGEGILLHLGRLLMVNTISKCTAVEIRIFRNIVPMVVERIDTRPLCRAVELVFHHLPLTLAAKSITYHTIIIGASLGFRGYIKLIYPSLTIGSAHLMLRLLSVYCNMEDKFLSINGFIIYIKLKYHTSFLRLVIIRWRSYSFFYR